MPAKLEIHFAKGRPTESREARRAADLRSNGEFAQEGGGSSSPGASKTKRSAVKHSERTDFMDEIGCWNARSLNSDARMGELREILEGRERTAVIGVGETWQTYLDGWHEKRLPGYRWLGRPRKEGRRGGGVAFVVRKELVDNGTFCIVDDNLKVGGSEAFMIASIRHPQGLVYLINGYVEGENRERILREIGGVCKKYRSKRGVLDVILMGDLNVQTVDIFEEVSPMWGGSRKEPEGARNVGSQGERKAFIDSCDEFGGADFHAHHCQGYNTRICQTDKTNEQSRIDHMIVSKPELYSASGVQEEIWCDSDHRYLWLRVGNWGRVQSQPVARSKERVWNTNKLTGKDAEENIEELAIEARKQLRPERTKLDFDMGKFQSKDGIVSLEKADEHLSKQAEALAGALVRAGNKTIGKKSRGGGFSSQDGKSKPRGVRREA